MSKRPHRAAMRPRPTKAAGSSHPPHPRRARRRPRGPQDAGGAGAVERRRVGGVERTGSADRRWRTTRKEAIRDVPTPWPKNWAYLDP